MRKRALITVYSILFSLSLADIASTLVGLRVGLRERNPFLPAMLLQNGRVLECVLLNAIVLLLPTLFYVAENGVYKMAGRLMVCVMIAVRTVVLFNNITLILLRLLRLI